MRKAIFGFIATAMFSTVSFANTPTLENEIDVTKENSKKVETVCSVTCSRVIGGVTYTTEAGNFLSTCEGAARRCEAKLDKLSTLQ
ncbi:hypothetical protein [Flavobacterium sp. 25HG05S-40]|uniref:hypothetical protein n=1 Tax=Flavobacterium sp. 25HG05S-40 TaxID=3458682 RepID=UPI004044CDE3